MSDVTGQEDGAITLAIAASPDPKHHHDSPHHNEHEPNALTIIIQGVPEDASLSAGTRNADGSWTLTQADLTGLQLIPAANTSGIYTLTVTAVAPRHGWKIPQSEALFTVQVDGVADTPELMVTGSASGSEDGVIAININAGLTDLDGSESLSITISGVPVGATLSAGIDNGDGSWSLSGEQLAGLTLSPPSNYSGALELTVTAISTEANGSTASATAAIAIQIEAVTDNGDGSWTLTSNQLSRLYFLPPTNYAGTFELTVTATATEANGASASTTSTLAIAIEPVADKPILTIPVARGDEDTAIPLDIRPELTDTDGSEYLLIFVQSVPPGATLSAGTYLNNSNWSLTPDQLPGLTFTPPKDYSGTIKLAVSAVSIDSYINFTTTVALLKIIVDGVADTPELVVPASLSALAGSTVAMNLAAALTDTDGSETLAVTISGLPTGVMLSAGTESNGIWTLTAADLTGLMLTTPPTMSGAMDLQVTAQATEDNGNLASTTSSLLLTVESHLSGATIIGTPLDDTLTGTDGDDIIYGLEGDDSIAGAGGNDLLYGGSGDDLIGGGPGDDIIYGGPGWDILGGGAGNDTFVVTPDDELNYPYSGGDGYDIIDARAVDKLEFFWHWSNNTWVEEIIGNGTTIIAGSDTYGPTNLLGFENTKLVGISGIYGQLGNDTIRGSQDSDLIVGGKGNDNLSGEGGDDTFLVEEGDGIDNYIKGGDGYDRIDATGTSNLQILNYSGLNTVEEIQGNGSTVISGSTANNTLDFRATLLDGMAEIRGLAGTDTIYGSAGNDVINGGTGNDQLYGGGGNDTFIFETGCGADWLNDFSAGAGTGDVIDLSAHASGYGSLQDVLANTTQSGANAVIDLGGGDSITVASVQLTNLDTDDFNFG